MWQNVAKSTIVYISANANLEEVLPLLQKDLGFLPNGSIVLRVPNLPLGSLIEIELLAENQESTTVNLGCQQFTYSSDQLMNYLENVQTSNKYGEIFYKHG